MACGFDSHHLHHKESSMKIPKYVDLMLKERVRAAVAWNEADFAVSCWCDSHGIELDTCDCHGGVEGIVNPEESADRIREAIKMHE